MKFSRIALGLLGTGLILSLGITLQLHSLPLEFDIVSADPNLIVLHANRPINTLSDARIGVDNVKTFVSSSDVYIQPTNPLSQGETITVNLGNITDSFGQDHSQDIDILVADMPLYYVDLDGRLVAHNTRTNEMRIITPDTYVVNEYSVGNGEAFFLGFEKTNISEDVLGFEYLQSLYHIDLSTYKITQLSDSERYSHQDLSISPDGKILAVYRGDLIERDPPFLWLYDTNAKTWAKYWSESFGAANPVVFSPDNMWLLGIDLEIQGFALSPTKEGPGMVRIGNFDNSFGISSNGAYLLFRQWSENDVFSGGSFFSLFDASGESVQVLESLPDTDLAVFDPVGNGFFFTYSVDDIPQVGYYDISENNWEQVTDFVDAHRIVGITPSRYEPVIVVSEEMPRSFSFDSADGPGGLLDAYFGSTPGYQLWSVNLETGDEKILGQGILPKW